VHLLTRRVNRPLVVNTPTRSRGTLRLQPRWWLLSNLLAQRASMAGETRQVWGTRLWQALTEEQLSALLLLSTLGCLESQVRQHEAGFLLRIGYLVPEVEGAFVVLMGLAEPVHLGGRPERQ
jgi:hypothetical protein